MTKIFLKKTDNSKKKKCSLDEIKKVLSEENACYVLITCSEPSNEGKMNVEMSYDGDENLASYLLHSAQNIFENQIDESVNSNQE
jgi:hypothetical protein